MRLRIVGLVRVDEVDVRSTAARERGLIVEVHTAKHDVLALKHHVGTLGGDEGRGCARGQLADNDQAKKAERCYSSDCELSDAHLDAQQRTLLGTT
jgi:hypothetical protein